MLRSSTLILAGVVIVFESGAACFGVFSVSSFFESFGSALFEVVEVAFLRSGLATDSRRAGVALAGETVVDGARFTPFFAPFFAAAFFLASFSAFFFFTRM